MDINSIRLAFGTTIWWLKEAVLWDTAFVLADGTRLLEMHICRLEPVHKHPKSPRGVNITERAQRYPYRVREALY